MDLISPLNRWRSQIFRYVGRVLEWQAMIQELTVTRRRMIGISKNGPVPYCKDELDLVTEQFVLHKQRALENELEADDRTMNWDSIAKSYNERFEGKMLPDCEDMHYMAALSSLSSSQIHLLWLVPLVVATPIQLNVSTSPRRRSGRYHLAQRRPRTRIWNSSHPHTYHAHRTARPLLDSPLERESAAKLTPSSTQSDQMW